MVGEYVGFRGLVVYVLGQGDGVWWAASGVLRLGPCLTASHASVRVGRSIKMEWQLSCHSLSRVSKGYICLTLENRYI